MSKQSHAGPVLASIRSGMGCSFLLILGRFLRMNSLVQDQLAGYSSIFNASSGPAKSDHLTADAGQELR